MVTTTRGLAFSQPSARVIEGIAVIRRHNSTDARHRALQSSWRSAVEQAVAELTTIDKRMANAQKLQVHVYEQALHYIQNFRIRWEYSDEMRQVYRVKMAVVVDTERLKQTLVELGVIPTQRQMPRELVRLAMYNPVDSLLCRSSAVSSGSY